ncbi:MAG: ABC transporter permease [Candidatus Limnocylindrales bacterium]
MTSNTSAVSPSRERLAAFVRKYLIVLILLVGMALLAIVTNGKSVGGQNLINTVRQSCVYGILGLGVMVVIISGGIDLSIGSILGLAAVLSASFAQQADWSSKMYPGFDPPVIVPLLAALGVGALCGLINGGLIAGFRIPPFIATLGMLTAARGVDYLYTNGRPVSSLTPEYDFIGQANLLGVSWLPMPIVILVVVAVLTHLMLNNTRFGRHVYAVGGNEQAAVVSGINLTRTKLGIYAFAGLLAGLSGMVLAARVDSGQPGLGQGFELQAITAAVIGGTSFTGGIGTVWGTIVGALIIGVLGNAMDLLNVGPFWVPVVQGVVIVVAIIIDVRKNA